MSLNKIDESKVNINGERVAFYK